MATKTLDQPIEITPGIVGGRPRIAVHCITVEHIAIWHERLGKGVDEIAAECDLTLGDIHAAGLEHAGIAAAPQDLPLAT